MVNQLTVPLLELPRESYLFIFLYCVRLCDGNNRDVRYTVMILSVICQLMCVTDPWAHMSYSILSLKLGVTAAPSSGHAQEAPQARHRLGLSLTWPAGLHMRRMA